LRDWSVAWRKVQKRSIITAIEYMDMMKSTMTTAPRNAAHVLGHGPEIELHRVLLDFL
jgi:hypothetical protein